LRFICVNILQEFARLKHINRTIHRLILGLDGEFFSINQQKGKHMNGMYQRDHKIAFENAKAKGLNNPNEYMYMYSKDGKDFFKNTNFRNYINFAIA